jgi:hypothetical protein
MVYKIGPALYKTLNVNVSLGGSRTKNVPKFISQPDRDRQLKIKTDGETDNYIKTDGDIESYRET